MAPKRQTLLEYPPSASSDSDSEVEEEVSHESGVEHESSDSDETEDSQLNSGTVKSVDAAAAAKPREEEKVLVKKRKKREFEEEQIVSDSHLVRLLSTMDSGLVGVSEESVRIGLSLIGKTKRVKMAKQWEKLLIDETELLLKRIELHMEMVKLVLDALRASSP